MQDMNAFWQTYFNCAPLVILGVSTLLLLCYGLAILCAAGLCHTVRKNRLPALSEPETEIAAPPPFYPIHPLF